VVDLEAADRTELAELIDGRMTELGFSVQDAAQATTLSPSTVRTRYLAGGTDTTVDLWALVALCTGLGLEVADVAELVGVEIDDKALETAQRSYRRRRVQHGLPAEAPAPRKAAPRAAPNGTGPAVGGSLREAIEAIVDERVEQRLAELLSS
jgi:hypothetical protein